MHALVKQYRLEQYLAWFRTEYARLDIEDNYVDLSAASPQYDAVGDEISRVLVKPLDAYIDNWLEVSDTPLLTLLGSFGSGKSWFCWYYANALLTRSANQDDVRLPVIIQMNLFHDAESFDDLITAFIRRHNLQMTLGV